MCRKERENRVRLREEVDVYDGLVDDKKCRDWQ